MGKRAWENLFHRYLAPAAGAALTFILLSRWGASTEWVRPNLVIVLNVVISLLVFWGITRLP